MKILSLCILSTMLFFSCSDTHKIAADSNSHKLHGTWKLNYITGPRIAFDGLYPDDKPTLSFDISGKRISGNTSCNTFSGSFSVESSKISFTSPLATTKMSCPGEGESVFLNTLAKINSYDVTEGYTLSLFTDGVASMRFTKVK